jgi:hypothetical protein
MVAARREIGACSVGGGLTSERVCGRCADRASACYGSEMNASRSGLQALALTGVALSLTFGCKSAVPPAGDAGGGGACSVIVGVGVACAPGQTCVQRSTTTTACIALDAAPVGEGERCASDAACLPGHVCLAPSPIDPDVRMCLRNCRFAERDCPRDGAACVYEREVPGGASPVGACTIGCDPIARTGCATDFTCHATTVQHSATSPVTVANGTAITICAVPAPTLLTDGEVCGGHRECMPGSSCIASGAGAPRTCRRLCDDAHPCGGGAACGPIGTGLTIAGRVVGVCP